MLDKVKEVEKEFHLNLVELNLNDNSLSGPGGKVLGKFVVIAASLGTILFSLLSLSLSLSEWYYLQLLRLKLFPLFEQRYSRWRIVIWLPLLEKLWALLWKPTRNFFPSIVFATSDEGI